MCLFCAFSSLCFSLTIMSPGRGGVGLQLLGSFTTLVALNLAYRSVTGGIIFESAKVRYRALIRTVRWPKSEIERFEVRDGRVGMLAYRRRIVWIVLTDGRDRKLETLNFAPKDANVDEIVLSLNAALAGS